MSRKVLGVVATGLAGVVWVGVSAQQEMQSRPGPGTGVMNVNVVNHPAVTASQQGDWRVSIANVPDVRVSNTVRVSVKVPDFVQRGRSYAITWGAGEAETITVQEISEDGWVLVSGSSRWLNLANARAVEAR